MRVAILRRPEGLFELFIEREGEFVPPEVHAPLEEASTFSERIAPMEFGTKHEIDKVLGQAEESLKAALLGENALAQILHVLTCSAPDPDSFDHGLPLPTLPVAPQPPRRTAAHPRAYRGTKRTLPKPSKPQRLNLLPHLDGASHEAQVLHHLSPYLTESLQIKPYEEWLEAPSADGHSPLIPFGQCWTKEDTERIARMPSDFKRLFLWQLRAVESAILSRVIALYWALELHTAPPLRLIVAKGLSAYPTDKHLDWWETLQTIAPNRRLAFAELLAQHGSPSERYFNASEIIARHESLCDDTNYRHRTHKLLRSFPCDNPHYLLDGFELANEFKPYHEFYYGSDSPSALVPIKRAMQSLACCDEEYPHTLFAMVLWETCDNNEPFAEFLEAYDWDLLNPEISYLLLDAIVDASYQVTDAEKSKAGWALVIARIPGLHRLVSNLHPDYQLKAIRHASPFLQGWDALDELQPRLDWLEKLLPRVCAEQFSTQPAIWSLLEAFAFGDQAVMTAVEQAPDAFFVRMEKECQRDNTAFPIYRGITSMAKYAPLPLATAITSGTGAIWSTAKTLGSHSYSRQQQLLVAELRSPLFCPDPESIGLIELVELMEKNPVPAAATLVRRKLKDQLAQPESMNPEKVQSARARILENWPELQMSRLAQAAVEAVGTPLGIRRSALRPQDRHSLLTLVSVDKNKRILRRVLKAHYAGDPSFLRDHVSNRNWWLRHATISEHLWTQGIQLSDTVSGRGTLTLSIERDLLEVLRMGTYVGSCLGLGGAFTYSAAAAALDVNKQVVYCRNAKGKVVGRQLLGISESNTLYCFEVYPTNAGKEIEALFHRFDRKLAAILGIPLHNPEAEDAIDADEAIPTLVATDWWDDGSIEVPEDETTAGEMGRNEIEAEGTPESEARG